jgi:hypothetical protein
MLGASRARACRARALALVLASLGPGGCYLLPDDSADDEECRDATTTLAHDGVFELERSGKQIEVAPIIATIEGTTSGVLQWTQVGRSTDLTLTIAADPEQPVTVFGDCDTYSGIDIPAHLELTSADGVLAERFVGQVSLDRQGRVIGGPLARRSADRLQLESVLPSGFVRARRAAGPSWFPWSSDPNWSCPSRPRPSPCRTGPIVTRHLPRRRPAPRRSSR